MLLSIALILLSGLIFGFLCKTLRLPSLFGMIIAGILLKRGIVSNGMRVVFIF